MRALVCLFLLSAVVYAQGVIPINRLRPSLQRYLRLTEAQMQEMRRNVAQHSSLQSAALERILAVNLEIGVETRKPNPDPEALGMRYQEIDALCRQAEIPLHSLQEVQLRVLNDGQRRLLGPLREARRLEVLARFARAAFLIPSPPEVVASRVFGGTPYLGASPTSSTLSADLVAYLGLSSSQLDRIRLELDAYEQFFTTHALRMREVATELEVEFSRDSADSLAVGARYWEIEALRRQIAERESALSRDLALLLTTEQQARLLPLRDTFDLGLLRSDAAALGLIVPEGPPTGLSVNGGFTVQEGVTAANTVYRTCRASLPATGAFDFPSPSTTSNGALPAGENEFQSP